MELKNRFKVAYDNSKLLFIGILGLDGIADEFHELRKKQLASGGVSLKDSNKALKEKFGKLYPIVSLFHRR